MADCPKTEKTKDGTDGRIGNYMAEFECPNVSF